jgi:hypothetical protein
MISPTEPWSSIHDLGSILAYFFGLTTAVGLCRSIRRSQSATSPTILLGRKVPATMEIRIESEAPNLLRVRDRQSLFDD